MKIYNYKWVLLLFAGLFVGCSSDDDNGIGIEQQIEYTSGSADFSTFVALGNSLSSGFTDGALFSAGQNNSMPNILAQQFELAGGGGFTQPIVPNNIGGLLLGGNVIAAPRLFFNGSGPSRISATPTTEVTPRITGRFNNMAVPGAKSFHLLLEGYGNVAGVATGQANPYFARFASINSASILGDAIAQNPTFFSLWIGNNDVLSYATSGGAGVNQTGNMNPATYGSNDITDPEFFKNRYELIVADLKATGANGVVANIPNVMKVPYFTTVPHAPLSPANPAFAPLIPTLNQTFGGLNQVFAALGVPERSIVFSTTAASPVVIKDKFLTDLGPQIAGALMQGGLDEGTAKLFGMLYGQARQATASDLLVLPSSSIIGQPNAEAFAMLTAMNVPAATAGQLSVNGVTFPLEDKWVLTPAEQAEVLAATTAFNQIIKKVADDNGLAFVDVNSILNQVATTGVVFDEFSLNARLVFGGAFSLDGIHPTARGNAYIANKFMEAINAKFGSNLPPVKAAGYVTLFRESM